MKDYGDIQLWTRDEVCEATGVSRSTLDRLRKEKKFPPPLDLGCDVVRWRKVDVLQWVESHPPQGPQSLPPPPFSVP